jgi:3-methyl-2-oxobutanoate hydroxymethyltransferase
MADKKIKITLKNIQEMKAKKQKIVMLTAYDYPFAKILDEIGVEIILIGDSLGNVILGYENTLPVTMEEMLHHVKAVSRGVKNAFVVADMPFLSFQINEEEALRNAGRFIKEGGAQAVKIEGGKNILNVVRKCVDAGIPVMSHLGFTPQSVHQLGGYCVQGKTSEAADELLKDAKLLEENGVFAIVLEMVPEEAARKITNNLKIPTIGIGAGQFCDGQVLVTHDILGLTDFSPKFAKKYVDIKDQIKNGVGEFVKEVKEGKFPHV